VNLTLPHLGVLAYAAASDRFTIRQAAKATSLPGETARDAVEELAEGGLLERNGTAGLRARAYTITPNGLAALAVITEQGGGTS